jgi:hypothetical protein
MITKRFSSIFESIWVLEEREQSQGRPGEGTTAHLTPNFVERER